MKYNGIEYLFDIDKVTDIWISFADNIALNENKEISVNVMKANGKRKPISRDFPSGNKIVCILERVEDGLNYLNSYELKQDFTYKSTHNRRERPVYGHRGGSRGRFYYRITTFEERPWDARDPH